MRPFRLLGAPFGASLALLAAPLAAPAPVHAQPSASQPTTLLARRPSLGGYVGLEGHYGSVRDQAEVLAGAELSLLLDHRLSLGVVGVGLSVRDDGVGPTTVERLRLGYGGVRVGYRVRPELPVHPTADLLVGGGGSRRTLGAARHDVDAFFVLEPTLGAEINLARPVRLGLGVSYRHVGGLRAPELRDADLRGVTAHLAVRAGRF